MISVLRVRPNSRIFQFLQLGAALMTLVIVAAFLRFSLQSTSTAFRGDFERQSFLELSRGDIFLVARKLAALAKSDQITCVTATKNGVVFFEERKGSCRRGFFRTVERVQENNQKIEIIFTLQLQSELLLGFTIFFILQVLLMAGIWLAQTNSILSAHFHDLALANLARQVGHDIRSPLAMLSQPGVDPDFFARALSRMHEMVERLLGEQMSERGQIVTLQKLVRETVEEKKVENSARLDISISGSTDSIYASGSSFLWRRVLSNLLNNSVEASLPNPPKIEIKIHHAADMGTVEIRDYGRGVPSQIMSKLGAAGFSFGKIRGRGLGLSSAFEFMKSIGGSVEIRSVEGRGTSVFLHFHLITPEAVLIDDDDQLALVWKIAAKRSAIRLHYFSRPDDFLKAVEKIPNSATIYLDISFPDSAFDPEAFGAILKKKGFHNIFLATGHSAERFKNWSWIVGIVGKEPPFI